MRPRLFAALAALALILLQLATPAPAQSLPTIAASRSAMKPLSPAQQQALVMLVGMRVKANSARLPRGDAKSSLRSMKIVALENVHMAAVAKDAGWPGMQQYYRDAADMTTRVIRGQVQGAKAVAAAQALEKRRRALMSEAFARVNAARISPQDPRLNARADALAAEVARRARAAVRG